MSISFARNVISFMFPSGVATKYTCPASTAFVFGHSGGCAAAVVAAVGVVVVLFALCCCCDESLCLSATWSAIIRPLFVA